MVPAARSAQAEHAALLQMVEPTGWTPSHQRAQACRGFTKITSIFKPNLLKCLSLGRGKSAQIALSLKNDTKRIFACKKSASIQPRTSLTEFAKNSPKVRIRVRNNIGLCALRRRRALPPRERHDAERRAQRGGQVLPDWFVRTPS